MFHRLAGGVTALALACVPGAAVDGVVSLDVVMEGDGARIYLMPLDRDCACSTRFLADATCGITFSDNAGCTCDGRQVVGTVDLMGCVRAIRGATGSGAEDNAVEAAPGVLALGGGVRELIIDGCGAVTRIPLDVLAAPSALGAVDVRRTGPGAADARVDVAGASHAQLCSNTGFVETCCDGPPGRVPVPVEARPFVGTTLALAAIAGPVEHHAPSGPVRVWRRDTRMVGPGVAVPEPDGDRWVVDIGRTAAISLSDVGFSVEELAFDAASPGELTLASELLSATLGVVDDRVEFDVGEGALYAGAARHPPAQRTLALGELVENVLDVGPAPIILHREDDPSRTLAESFRVFGRLPAIAAPGP